MRFRPALESLTERIVPDANSGAAPDPNQPPANPAPPANPPLDKDRADNLKIDLESLKAMTETLERLWKPVQVEIDAIKFQYQRLADMQKELADAIKNGVPQTEIDALKQKVKEQEKFIDELKYNLQEVYDKYNSFHKIYYNLWVDTYVEWLYLESTHGQEFKDYMGGEMPDDVPKPVNPYPAGPLV